MKKPSIRSLAAAAMVAALYTALSFAVQEFAFGGAGMVQFRLSEALTVVPFFFPEAAWGLFVGCILTNIISPMGIPDLIFGSLATLIAGLITARVPRAWMAPIPPILSNMLIVGAMIAWYETGFGQGFMASWAVNGALVALGEIVCAGILGGLLLALLPRVLPRDLNQRARDAQAAE